MTGKYEEDRAHVPANQSILQFTKTALKDVVSDNAHMVALSDTVENNAAKLFVQTKPNERTNETMRSKNLASIEEAKDENMNDELSD